MPTIVDPNKMLSAKEYGKRDPMQPTMPVIPKPVNIVTQAAFIPIQMPPSNVRTRIAPVNPTMVSSVRLRDPRLARQPPPTMMGHSNPNLASHQNDHIQKLPPRKYKKLGCFSYL